MRADEVVKRKAGVIPYYIDHNGQVQMKFFIPSDSEYGGPKPQIAKGEVDPGEDEATAAVREGSEEVGLVEENISLLEYFHTQQTGDQYEPAVTQFFIAEVIDPETFTEPGFETGAVMWLTPQQFASQGRSNQRQIVAKAFSVINQTLNKA